MHPPLQIMPVVLVLYILLNVYTFFSYYRDKFAAANNLRRTPEKRLHILSLMGGWQGALLAIYFLRHKSQKFEFLAVYVVTVILNLMIYSLIAKIVP